MNTITESLSFTVPLSYQAHDIAQQIRQGITNPEKSKQVYLNTLAVYAVNYYLNCMDLETDWENSDSSDSIAVQLSNIADLELKNLGKLECRPVLPDENSFEIPPEVREDRIGYVAVQLNHSLKEAKILGYVKTPAAVVSLNQLESLEDFLVHVSTLEEATERKLAASSPTTQLGQWLEGVIEEGWQRLEDIFTPQKLGLAFMNEVSPIRGQILDFGLQLNQFPLALVVKVTSPESSDTPEADILMQVRPMTEATLPAGIGLQIKNAAGEIVLQTTSREEDNWIQLAFSAEYGENFQTTVVYQDVEINKHFVI